MNFQNEEPRTQSIYQVIVLTISFCAIT